MGKKRIIKKTEEELLKETESVESSMRKKVNTPTSLKTKDVRIYISSSYNNTLITMTDTSGNVLLWSSAGSIGFKGTKKSTPFAASKVAETIYAASEKLKIGNVEIYVRGIGSGRDSAVRSLAAHGMNIISIKDITPVPHNGCRPPKVRRV